MDRFTLSMSHLCSRLNFFPYLGRRHLVALDFPSRYDRLLPPLVFNREIANDESMSTVSAVSLNFLLSEKRSESFRSSG